MTHYIFVVEVPRDMVGVVVNHPRLRTLFGPQQATDGYALSERVGGPDTGGVDPLLLTYQQVAHALGISHSKVKELVCTGALKTIAIDSSKRVPVSEVQRFVVDRLERESA